MKKVKLTKLNKKTILISNKFFDDIKDLKPRQDNYEFKLFPRIEKFFKDMNQLSREEFALYINEQKYTSNTFPDNPNCHQRNSDVFYCLTALLVSNYSESELARHFLPSHFREEVGKPVYSNESGRINYWLQLLRYWFGTKKYKINNDPALEGEGWRYDPETMLSPAIEYVSGAMRQGQSSYAQLIQSKQVFQDHLAFISQVILQPHYDFSPSYKKGYSLHPEETTNSESVRGSSIQHIQSVPCGTSTLFSQPKPTHSDQTSGEENENNRPGDEKIFSSTPPSL